jgi:hypothetical protein
MSSWAALMPQPDIVDLQTFSAQKSSSSGEAQFIDLSGALGSVVREGRPVGFDPTGALRSAVGHDLEKQRREGKHDGGGFTDALRLAVEADLKKQRQLREGKPVGRRYEGVEVLVAFDSPFKGMRGVVVGDFDSPGRAARIQKCKQVKDDDGIMVTVQKEHSNARFTLDINKLVHVQYVSLPLALFSSFEKNFEVLECRSQKQRLFLTGCLLHGLLHSLLALVHRSHRPARQRRPHRLLGCRIAEFSTVISAHPLCSNLF